jgi:DNA-binding PadR family transcriptional regulator
MSTHEHFSEFLPHSAGANETGKVRDIPLSHLELKILLALKANPSHGYGIYSSLRNTWQSEGPKIVLSSTYNSIHGLKEKNFIEPVASGLGKTGHQMLIYAVTMQGEQKAIDELERMQTIVNFGRSKGLLE